jgi:hypothetical protein
MCIYCSSVCVVNGNALFFQIYSSTLIGYCNPSASLGSGEPSECNQANTMLTAVNSSFSNTAWFGMNGVAHFLTTSNTGSMKSTDLYSVEAYRGSLTIRYVKSISLSNDRVQVVVARYVSGYELILFGTIPYDYRPGQVMTYYIYNLNGYMSDQFDVPQNFDHFLSDIIFLDEKIYVPSSKDNTGMLVEYSIPTRTLKVVYQCTRTAIDDPTCNIQGFAIRDSTSFYFSTGARLMSFTTTSSTVMSRQSLFPTAVHGSAWLSSNFSNYWYLTKDSTTANVNLANNRITEPNNYLVDRSRSTITSLAFIYN